MHTQAEYLAKADELEARAAQCEPGSSQDAFTVMARQWRELAERAPAHGPATQEDYMRLAPATDDDVSN